MFYASTVNVFTWFHKRAFTATTSEVLRLDLFCMPPTGNVAEVISGILFSRCPSKYPIRFSRNTLHMLHPIEHLLAYCTAKHSRADPRDPLSVSCISGIPKNGPTRTRADVCVVTTRMTFHTFIAPLERHFWVTTVFGLHCGVYLLKIGWMKRANNTLVQQTWLMMYDFRLDK